MEKREFIVETPLGSMKVWSKHKTDCPDDYPGVYIGFIHEDGYESLLACVEFVSGNDRIQTCVYGEVSDDAPTEIVVHDLGLKGEEDQPC